MSNWGISPNASEKEKIKADYADILHGMNSTGAIPYDVYSDLFDDGMELLDRMYEQGKADAANVVERKRGEWEYVAENSTGKIFVCTVCNFPHNPNKRDVGLVRVDEKPNFCPNCGADMRG